MREIPLLFIALMISVLICGCTSTPADVSREVPGVLKNVSADASVKAGEAISSMKPLTTSSEYTTPVIPPTLAPATKDIIVGGWRYVGDSAYQCTASFSEDRTGNAVCSVSVIPIAQRSFTWARDTDTYGWMRNYKITDISDGSNYTVLYSEHTGQLTSEILPGNGYLVRM